MAIDVSEISVKPSSLISRFEEIESPTHMTVSWDGDKYWWSNHDANWTRADGPAAAYVKLHDGRRVAEWHMNDIFVGTCK